jgi:crossover junction endodeoxyribonuclease RuvC
MCNRANMDHGGSVVKRCWYILSSKKMTLDKIILGIDPGTNIMGYGIIKSGAKGPLLIDMGLVSLNKIHDPYKKLEMIFSETLRLIDEYKPSDLAIEAPFFGKNVQSMLKLGRAQGTAIAAAIFRNVEIFEYAPRKIKMSITGQGSASKEQVSAMLANMLDFTVIPKNLDATDGLAAAVCHYYQEKLIVKNNGPKSWEEFLKENPERMG